MQPSVRNVAYSSKPALDPGSAASSNIPGPVAGGGGGGGGLNVLRLSRKSSVAVEALTVTGTGAGASGLLGGSALDKRPTPEGGWGSEPQPKKLKLKLTMK